MSTTRKTLGSQLVKLENPEKIKIAIVVSEWNDEVTDSLYEAAFETLIDNGISKKNLRKKIVPGSFELPLGAQLMAEKKGINAVICLGCVIQGETKHFDFISSAVSHGITQVSLKYSKPIIFGVLTTDTHKQALDRAGGKYGNKGEEAAYSVLKMLSF